MRKIRLLAIAMAMLLTLCGTGFAQQAYVDLDARFSSQETYEYNGETYYLKNRVSTALVLCANLPEVEQDGAGSAEMILLLPIDDDSKTVTPVQFGTEMLASWLEGDEQEMTLGVIYAQAQTTQAGCEKLVEVLNALFPSNVIEQYALLDLRGLPVLDGIENDEINVTGEELIARLKNIKTLVEQEGGKDVNSMLGDMSGYIVTDMKSGAMMKIVDKVERYDRAGRTPFPVMEMPEETNEPLIPDLEAFGEMMLNIYYTDNSIWK